MAYSIKHLEDIKDLTFTEVAETAAKKGDDGSHVNLTDPYNLDFQASVVISTYWGPILRVTLESAERPAQLDEALQSVQDVYSGVLANVGHETNSGDVYLQARVEEDHFGDRVGVFCDEYATGILASMYQAYQSAS